MMTLMLRCLFFLQAHRLFGYLNRNKITILMYHGFTEKDKHNGLLNYHGKHVNVNKFRKQVEHVKKYYNLISLDQLIDYYANNKDVPDRAVALTFDDGYKSNYSLAYPILNQFNAPATIFLTTNFVENKEFLWMDRIEYALDMTTAKILELTILHEKYHFSLHDRESKIDCDKKLKSILKVAPQELRDAILDEIETKLGYKLVPNNDVPEIYSPLGWDEVTEMFESGLISIGSHTLSHSIVSQLSDEDMENELSLSKKILEKRTGVPCKPFSYPNGARGNYNAYSKNLLVNLGYSCGFIAAVGMNDRSSDVYELKRYSIHNKLRYFEFVMLLSGLTEYLLRIKYPNYS